METVHKVYNETILKSELKDNSVHLVVTSPPYPMIKMWDKQFDKYPEVYYLTDTTEKFYAIHGILDRVWKLLYDALVPGGIACINMGDATRRGSDDVFRLYPNHALIIDRCMRIGFDVLPMIHWNKPTNSPNKFMGSGMLPVNSYVTLENEYIIVLRKPGTRKFDRQNRYESAFFWEERNDLFSDVWKLKGTTQLGTFGSRTKTAAYPIELPMRLITMFSCLGDTVIDPFGGTGTTSRAAVVLGRSSIMYDVEKDFCSYALKSINPIDFKECEKIVADRVNQHIHFVTHYKHEPNFKNDLYGHVITKQETEIKLYVPYDVKSSITTSDGFNGSIEYLHRIYKRDC